MKALVSHCNNAIARIVVRPSSGSGDGDESSAGTPGSEIPQSRRNLRQNLSRREPFPAIQSDVSIPSAEEEQETKSEATDTKSDKIVLSNTQQLPPINTPSQQNNLVSMRLSL